MKLNAALDIIIRSGVFSYVLYAYLSNVNLRAQLMSGAPAVIIIWCVLMIGMGVQAVPFKNNGVSNNKQFSQTYVEPAGGYDAVSLAEEMRTVNRRAAGALIFWLSLNAAAALLYINHIISADEIIMLVMVYYLCDALCIAIWCPIQKIFMRSRCCADCRIYGWGYFLIFAPLILLPDFYTLTLVGLSLILLIRWEIRFKLHPERFFPDTNAAINCKMCTVPKCRVKNNIKKAVKKIKRASP